eukprot:4895007-Prymnesium_polylepis.1
MFWARAEPADNSDATVEAADITRALNSDTAASKGAENQKARLERALGFFTTVRPPLRAVESAPARRALCGPAATPQCQA